MKDPELRTTNVSISLPPALRDAARQAAFDDNRSFSSLVARLLSQYLQKEGYLEERAPVFRLRGDRLRFPLSLRTPRKNVFARPTAPTALASAQFHQPKPPAIAREFLHTTRAPSL